MFKSTVKSLTSLSLAALFLSSTASAGLIIEEYDSGTAIPSTLGGYEMTNFGVVNNTLSGDTSTAESPLGGQLTFTDKAGATLELTRGLADSTDWWINGESSDYDIFTTGVNWVTILLPEETSAFSFSVGANMWAGGWLKATETNGDGIDTRYNFNVNPNNTPGFGIYADRTSGECSYLTSITIDPLEWGMGNFSINNDPCSVSVSEPAPGLLLGAGLVGLLLSLRSSRSRKTRSI